MMTSALQISAAYLFNEECVH